MRELLDSLNSAQRMAVEHPGGPLLVIAGAGSGKTRVLTARVTWLIANGVRPDAILAFTFTNRAAREMRGRIAEHARAGPWVGTFHATGVRILRREAARLGLPRDFAIYDREDQETLIGEISRQLGWPESLKKSKVINAISDAKNAFVGPEEFQRTAQGPDARRIAEGYELYNQALRRNGALDFDDLIVTTARFLAEDPQAHEAWSRRFEHVLVDEYQDTNHAQFRLIRDLGAGSGNVFVVGDDDQSIYGWRGADLANVLEFEQAFPGASIVRLEQNYRSTGNILKAANAVIANNRARKGKQLWCEREDGPVLRFALALDEQDEARRVRDILAERRRRGGRLGDVAVLYRTHAQSRALETELRAALMPYEVVGGVAFYQRREIKDLIAYLRMALVPEDTLAFFRVWNTPRRGLGPVVRTALEERMTAARETALEALRYLVASGTLAAGARRGGTALIELADELRTLTEAPVDRLLVRVLERTGYLEWLGEDEAGTERRANVEELLVAASNAALEGRGVADFLAETALATDVDRMSETGDRTVLMTGHNAKGLEFPVVVVVGLEEGLFPHANSLDRPDRLEEERRLFYVALTRAENEVHLFAAAYRRRYDGFSGGGVSRFVAEIPAELLHVEEDAGSRRGHVGTVPGRDRAPRVREQATGGRAAAYDESGERMIEAHAPLRTTAALDARGRRLGTTVEHSQFGRGVVLDAEDEGDDVKYTVRFGSRVKKILGRFLKLEGAGK